MTLIHTALQSEAQSIIELYKLKLIDKNPRIYKNDNIILVISSIGQENTIKALNLVFNRYKITKAINIGIAGCNSQDIKIGELFCTNKECEHIKFINLETVATPQLPTTNYPLPTIFDMEGEYFKQACLDKLDNKDIYIFKIISDHLDNTIPNKEFVKQLIKKNIKSIEKWI